MDGTHFDALTRSFAPAGSRRGVLGGVLLASLRLFGWGVAEDATAHNALKACKKKSGKQKKKCVKKAKKHNASHTTPAPPGPVVQVFATPGRHTFTVPQAGTVRVEVLGGAGGRGGNGGAAGPAGQLMIAGGAGGPGGRGGKVTASFTVVAGEVLQINIAGAGSDREDGEPGEAKGGGGEGGQGGGFSEVQGGGGGPVVAGGGGGGGGAGNTESGTAGKPGGPGGNGAIGGAGGPGGPGGPLNSSGSDGDPGGPGLAFGPDGAIVEIGGGGGLGKVTVTFTPA